MIASMLIFLFFLIGIGAPVVFAMGISCLIPLIINGNIPLVLIPQRMFTGMDSFTLMAVPFFMLAGELMCTGGVTKRLVDFCEGIVGRVKGGMAHVNILASMLFAGLNGAAVADVAALGPIEIEMMTRNGFSKPYSAAVTASSSIIGPIIPPSIVLVIYAVTANVSIGGLFAGAILPGIFVGLMFMGLISYQAVKYSFPYRKEPLGLKVLFKRILVAIPSLIIPLIIVGGILFGVFTATEAGAVAVIVALFVSIFIYREFNIRELPGILKRVLISSGVVVFIIAIANIFVWLLSSQQVPRIIQDFITSSIHSKFLFLLFINVLLLIVGCVIESAAAIILLVPVLAPLAINFGIDPIQFGLVFVLNLVVGMITPPVGTVLYVTCGVAHISFEDLIKAIIPFLLIAVTMLLLITYVPFLTTFLPKLLGY